MAKRNLVSGLAFMKKLRKSKIRARKVLLKKANNSDLKVLSECALNVCSGNVPCSHLQRNRFKRYKKELLALCSKCCPLKKRKKILIKQAGGFIGPLLSVAIPALASILIDQVRG